MPDANTGPDVYDDLTKAEAQLARTQTQIQHLQTLAQKHRTEVDTKRRIVRSRCFVDRRMTDDILFYVFQYLVDDFSSEYPWLLELVCKRWRNVCLQNPKLWSYFYLHSHKNCGDAERYDHSMVIRTLLQLRRSESSPLSIEVDTLCQCASQLSSIRAVVKHSSRWKIISFGSPSRPAALSGSSSDILRRLMSSTNQFAQLQEIRWLGDDAHSCQLPFSDSSAFPQLSRVEIVHVPGFMATQIHLPWNQLTSLKLNCTLNHRSIRDFRLALSQTKNIIELILILNLVTPLEIGSEGDDYEDTITTLPHLKTLFFLTGNASILDRIIPHLKLPSLQSLSTSFIILSHQQLIADLLQRSSCAESLIKFTALTCIGLELAIIPVFQQCPNLTILEWYGGRSPGITVTMDAGNELLQSLTLHPEHKKLLPHLRRIGFFGLKFDPVVMMQMIDSRITEGSLESMSIGYLLVSGGHNPEYPFCKTLLERRYEMSKPKLSIYSTNVLKLDHISLTSH